MAAPKGNKHAAKAKIWTEAIERALNTVGGDKRKLLDAVAQSLVNKALEGDVSALKEIGDRLEGKAHQSVDAHIDTELIVQVVNFATKTDA